MEDLDPLTMSEFWIQECHYENGAIASVKAGLSTNPTNLAVFPVSDVLVNISLGHTFYTARVVGLLESSPRRGAPVIPDDDGKHITTKSNGIKADNLEELDRF